MVGGEAGAVISAVAAEWILTCLALLFTLAVAQLSYLSTNAGLALVVLTFALGPCLTLSMHRFGVAAVMSLLVGVAGGLLVAINLSITLAINGVVRSGPQVKEYDEWDHPGLDALGLGSSLKTRHPSAQSCEIGG